jgi:exosortase/archaeosortase family protein
MAKPSKENLVESEPALSRRPRFILTVVVYSVLVLGLSVLLLSNLVFDDLLKDVRVGVAHWASTVLAWLGLPVSSRGAVISGPGTSLIIVNECTGVDATILLVSAVLVFPAGLLSKLMGVLLACAVMLGVNFVRVLSLVYIGSYHLSWLDVGHLYVWPVVVILAGVGTLLFWAERIALPRPT